MTIYICVSVYYTIIRMAIEKRLMSGENVYDIVNGGQLPICSQIDHALSSREKTSLFPNLNMPETKNFYFFQQMVAHLVCLF